MSSNNDDISLSRPIGVVVMKDEPNEIVLIKFIAWIIVMVLFVIILITVSGYFTGGVCHKNLDGFLLKQERTDLEAV